MKVLLVNFTDVGGGAAIAAYRLAEALHKSGMSVTIGVVQKKSEASFVVEIPKKKQKKLVHILNRALNILSRLFQILFPFMRCFDFRTTNNILHSTNTYSLVDVNWINNFDCDVVNLHWIGSNMLSIKDIAKIKKPIVWTMHDSWPCCGAEHYQNILEDDCRWQEGYYCHNKPKTTKGADICRRVWKQKKKYLNNKQIIFVGPSRWQHDVLKASNLFHNNTCFVVPNIVPDKVFFKKEKDRIRTLLGIPVDKKIIGFGAAENLDDPKGRKGGYYLAKALECLLNSEEYFLVIFGPATGAFTSRITISHFASGYVESPLLLSLLYNACDVIVCPSLIENLPNVCLESLFCGVPVVAFDVGGTSDIVVHKETGFLATPYKSEELAQGIEWCVENELQLSKNCLEKAAHDFDEKQTVKKMIRVYESAAREN